MPERKLGPHEYAGAEPVQKGTQNAYFPEPGRYLPAPVFDRYALRSGVATSGPAIIEERESTLVIGPGGSASVDDRLKLIAGIEEL